MTSLLIENGTIVTMGADDRIIENGYVTVNDGKITGVGSMTEAVSLSGFDTVVDAHGKAVLPGFINAHTHLATECFRAVTDVYL